MTKYIVKRCKPYLWITIVVILLGAITTIMGNYIYKFIGFVIDYGLNFTGEEYSGEMAFLFNGVFGDYGSLKLIISICFCMVFSGLISYCSSLLSSYIQKRAQNYIANKYRVEFFKKSIGKKPFCSSGDMMVLLNEDIYQVSTIFISYYSAIFSSVLSIIYTIFMLNSISGYLLITPIVLSPLLIYCMIMYHRATYKQNKKYRNADGELQDCISEITASGDVEKYNKFLEKNEIHTKERQGVSYVSNRYTTIMQFVKLLIYIISCTVAGVLAINGKILIGEYLIFTTFINTIFTQIISLINNFISIKSAQPRIEKVKAMEEYLNDAR